MMFGIGKVTCSFCNTRARRRDARKAVDVKNAFVCGSCYASWEKSGRKCVECEAAVRGMQEIGFFTGKKNLGHVDCGGSRVLRA